jgi:hypothetical protein
MSLPVAASENILRGGVMAVSTITAVFTQRAKSGSRPGIQIIFSYGIRMEPAQSFKSPIIRYATAAASFIQTAAYTFCRKEMSRCSALSRRMEQ